jgi:hypothetical protein
VYWGYMWNTEDRNAAAAAAAELCCGGIAGLLSAL